MKNDNYERVIPSTEFRCFYNILKHFSSETQLNISRDFNRGENFRELCKLFIDSKQHFAIKYNNSEESFLGHDSGKRKDLSNPTEIISSTDQLCAFFNSFNAVPVHESRHLDFKYIEREVSIIRTTKANFESGKSGKKSGTGGLDFIGANLNDNSPILGEIKIGSDKNAFYALIQLLTHLSEISTANQIRRINNYNLFGKGLLVDENTKFYLYIILTELTEIRQEIFAETERLAGKLKGEISEIKDIVFLVMNTETKIIKQISSLN